MNEFDFIARLLQPLATNQAALKLEDDAAILNPTPGYELVISTDTLVASVHFFGTETPDLIAKKALRVNLSDLAAMGAKPVGYFLNISLPAGTDEAWLKTFTQGLAEDQKIFGLSLLGGDTTRTPGPLTISITALGEVPAGNALKRSGAKVGDLIYVSGTLGDAALALKLDEAYFKQRYQLPTPQLALGQQLRNIATSCMDISDGLVQDLGHICAASGVGATIHADKIPLSAAAHKAALMEIVLTGGDDYELLFTAPAGAALPSGVTEIGEVVSGKGVTVLDKDGNVLPLQKTGYQHF